jgi:hypothetical protein
VESTAPQAGAGGLSRAEIEEQKECKRKILEHTNTQEKELRECKKKIRELDKTQEEKIREDKEKQLRINVKIREEKESQRRLKQDEAQNQMNDKMIDQLVEQIEGKNKDTKPKKTKKKSVKSNSKNYDAKENNESEENYDSQKNVIREAPSQDILVDTSNQPEEGAEEDDNWQKVDCHREKKRLKKKPQNRLFTLTPTRPLHNTSKGLKPSIQTVKKVPSGQEPALKRINPEIPLVEEKTNDVAVDSKVVYEDASATMDEVTETVQSNETNDDEEKAKDKKPTLQGVLDTEIAAQARELECPVCLEESPPGAPIFMCEELHPVCSTCRPALKSCPSCRASYPAWGPARRHRYLETAATRLAALRMRRHGLL